MDAVGSSKEVALMDERSLLEIISQGENAAVEFKSASVRPESLAKEMVAFSNALGGTILIGVEDDGTISGVDAQRFEERVANICRHNVVPAINPVIDMVEINNLIVCAVGIPKGPHKPYQSLDGKFWVRVGSTNRQATKEELSRLFQSAGLVHFDISPVEGTSASDLDLHKAHLYWKGSYDIDFIDLDQEEQSSILINSDVLVPHEGNIVATVGGLLIFGKQPQRRLPQSSIMFALFKGRDVTAELVDKKEITGTLPELTSAAR